MSTRYVWKKYQKRLKLEQSDVKYFTYDPPTGNNSSGQLAGYFGEGPVAGYSDGLKLSTTPTPVNAIVSEYKRPDYYGYQALAPTKGGNDWLIRVIIGQEIDRTYFWSIEPAPNNKINVRLWKNRNGSTTDISSDNADQQYYRLYKITGQDLSPDYLLGQLSSSQSNKYPDNDFSGDYYYQKLGSDTIDPTGITYPTDQLRPGDIVNAAISPRAPTYGGTISYLYQYQINGGSWVNIQTTTATSIDFTIPANAKTIRFRVRAQDDMGFTSATYVTGASVAVERLNAWIGVNGKARKGVELYVGVNGKARKVTAAYIGVNGKARRFL